MARSHGIPAGLVTGLFLHSARAKKAQAAFGPHPLIHQPIVVRAKPAVHTAKASMFPPGMYGL